MGSIPVAGAKSHPNRFFGLGGFYHPHGEPSSCYARIGFAFLTKTVVCLQGKGRAKIVHVVNLPKVLWVPVYWVRISDESVLCVVVFRNEIKKPTECRLLWVTYDFLRLIFEKMKYIRKIYSESKSITRSG